MKGHGSLEQIIKETGRVSRLKKLKLPPRWIRKVHLKCHALYALTSDETKHLVPCSVLIIRNKALDIYLLEGWMGSSYVCFTAPGEFLSQLAVKKNNRIFINFAIRTRELFSSTYPVSAEEGALRLGSFKFNNIHNLGFLFCSHLAYWILNIYYIPTYAKISTVNLI
jgi:hypothetical protein